MLVNSQLCILFLGSCLNIPNIQMSSAVQFPTSYKKYNFRTISSFALNFFYEFLQNIDTKCYIR